MIDILLSTYNGESFLNAQIDSILSQTFSDWRLLIRDDGSKDETLAIINEYSLKHPKKILNVTDTKGNIGIITSFETLLKVSTASYIMFCDQDDVWLSHKIQKAFTAMKETEKIHTDKPIIICSDLIVVNDDLSVISNSYWDYAKINPDLLKTANNLAVNNFITGCTMLINRKARQISLPFGQNAIMHDSWIALKSLKNDGIIIRLSESDILYRQHGKNKIGAVNVKYGLMYFISKLLHLKQILIMNFLNYKQSKEAINISLFQFTINRTIYLIKR